MKLEGRSVKLCGMPRAPSASPVDGLQTCWFVYLLECEDGSLYTGVAIDVEARFIKHALGLGAAYTRSHPPLRVLACRSYTSRGDALRAEYAIKQLARESKLAFFEMSERLRDARLPALR